MKPLTKRDYFRFLSFMMMISAFLPLLFVNLPPYIRSHHLWTILWFTSLLFLKTRILLPNLFQFVLIYGAIMILLLLPTVWIVVDEWNRKFIIREFYEITVAISVIVYFRMERDYIGLAKIIRWTMLFISITAIMSIITSIINPMYARDIIGVASAESDVEREQILSYQKFGGGGYSFATALDCLFPILVYYFKNNSVSYYSKKILMLFIILFLIALFRMQIFANILVALVIIIFSWLGTRHAVGGFIATGALIIILLIIPVQAYISVFQVMASWFKIDSELYYKFSDISQFLATGGSDQKTGVVSRAARYPMLWQSFKDNPFLGHFHSTYFYKDISSGAHLFWMNKLAVFGLLGTLPFLLIIYKHIKKNIKCFNEEFIFYFVLSLISIIALGTMKILGGREFWYTFIIIIPGLYYLPLMKKNKLIFGNKSRTKKTLRR